MIKILKKKEEVPFNSNNDEVYEKTSLNTVTELNKKIEEIENNYIEDEFFFENNGVGPVKENTKEEVYTQPQIIDDFELFEIIEGDKNDQLTASSVDKLDDDIANMKDHIVDNAIYHELETEGPTDIAIAFGGSEQKENSTHGKENENKCSRCGSSLIGANGFCPGCGAQL